MRKGDGSGRAAGSAAGSSRQVRVGVGSGSGLWETRWFHADDTVARCRVCSLTKQQQQTRRTQKAGIRKRNWHGRMLGHLSYTGSERDGRAEEQSEWAIRGASSVH